MNSLRSHSKVEDNKKNGGKNIHLGIVQTKRVVVVTISGLRNRNGPGQQQQPNKLKAAENSSADNRPKFRRLLTESTPVGCLNKK